MISTEKIIPGVILALLGAAGIILGPLLGFTELERPWSFILGFGFGILTGLGVALALFGLYEMKK